MPLKPPPLPATTTTESVFEEKRSLAISIRRMFVSISISRANWSSCALHIACSPAFKWAMKHERKLIAEKLNAMPADLSEASFTYT